MPINYAQLIGGPTSGLLDGMRNRIINGDMRIDQRNAGAAITGITGGPAYAVDRFSTYNQTSGNYTAQQVTDAPTGFKNSLKVTVATAANPATAGWTSFILQYIEGFNTADFGGGTASPATITLSFWVKCSLTGTFPLLFNNGTGGTSSQYLTTYTISSANTWEKKVATVTLPTAGTWNTNNLRGIGIAWGLGSGSSYSTSTINSWQNESPLPNYYYFVTGNTAVGATLGATFQLTGVQLEVGSVASDFERRNYGQELALCQRYFVKGGYGMTVLPQTATTADGFWQAPVPMRTTSVTVTHLNDYPLVPNNAGTNRTGSATTLTNFSPNGFLRVSLTSGSLTTTLIYINRDEQDNSFSVSAEL